MRTPLLLTFTITFAVFVASGCGQYGQRYTGDAPASNGGAADSVNISDKPFDEAERTAHACEEIKEFDPIATDTSAGIGIFDDEKRDAEHLATLKSGDIVIAHKGLADEDLAALELDAKKLPNSLTTTARDENPKDGVYYTAWTAQLYCETPTSAGLQVMADDHLDRGPEITSTDEDEPSGGDADQ